MKKGFQSGQTRERILHAAARCFAEKGYSACSMNDIAAASGLSKGALYGHFPSKEELFRTMIISEHDRGARMALKAAEQGPYIGAITGFMEECIKNWGFPIDHRLWIEMLAVASRDPAMRDAFMESERRARNVFKQLIQKGIDAGEIEPTVDPDAISILLFALGDGIIARIADDPAYDFQKHFGVFEDVVRNALQKRGDPPRQGGVNEQGQNHRAEDNLPG